MLIEFLYVSETTQDCHKRKMGKHSWKVLTCIFCCYCNKSRYIYQNLIKSENWKTANLATLSLIPGIYQVEYFSCFFSISPGMRYGGLANRELFGSDTMSNNLYQKYLYMRLQNVFLNYLLTELGLLICHLTKGVNIKEGILQIEMIWFWHTSWEEFLAGRPNILANENEKP